MRSYNHATFAHSLSSRGLLIRFLILFEFPESDIARNVLQRAPDRGNSRFQESWIWTFALFRASEPVLKKVARERVKEMNVVLYKIETSDFPYLQDRLIYNNSWIYGHLAFKFGGRSHSSVQVIRTFGEFSDAVVLKKFGDVPEDLSAL